MLKGKEKTTQAAGGVVTFYAFLDIEDSNTPHGQTGPFGKNSTLSIFER